MLSKIKTIAGYQLACKDGDIGRAREFYFDDKYWTIRYLVANTGSWLTGRLVLISPYALLNLVPETKTVTLDLTKEQIKNSPSLDADKPVSRQFEDSYYGYYGFPAYWEGPYNWGYSPTFERNRESWGKFQPGAKAWDHHLRSTLEVTGYEIQATDGVIGHVVDFILDDRTWEIRYLIISTANWWPGKHVLVSPQWIERVSWTESKVHIDLTRKTIQDSPEFTEADLVTRDYEIVLHGHYNRKGYWVNDLKIV
jgi:hypothetical protein